MLLSELIEKLQDVQRGTSDDPVVLLATQPSWSFEYSIGRQVILAQRDSDGEDAVFITEGGSQEYLSEEARAQLGW